MQADNRIPGFHSADWRTWAPREALSPQFIRESASGTADAVIQCEDYDRFGFWKCTIDGIVGGQVYRFEVEYLPDRIPEERMSVVALLAWEAADGEMLTRDYVVDTEPLADGWRRMSRTIDAPARAGKLTVELGLRWAAGGSVRWRNPSVRAADPIRHRKVNVATTYLPPHYDLAKNLKAMLDVIDKAGAAGADIVCLSETYYDRGVDLPFAEIETVPGRLTDLLAEKARKYGCYVIVCLRERDGDRLYAAAVLIDRSGNIAGKYRKTHIPLCEAESGLSAASEYPVFRTDFGTIGMLICFDCWFPEPAKRLVDNGAELLFITSIGDSPLQFCARAADNAVPVVVSGAAGPHASRIIAPSGDIICEVESEEAGFCLAEIDLDQRFYQFWLDVGPADGEPRVVFRKQRRTDTYT
jgi:predicted amidohydrolase